ncbi:MAG: hypothetical protein ABEJ28_01505 [Salinigranum sp.]
MVAVPDVLVVCFGGATLAVVVAGLRQRNPVSVLNGLFAFAVSALPLAVGASPLAAAWVAAVGLLHAVGSAGWYERVWWWDHVAHTVAGGLVAAIGYGTIVTAVAASDARVSTGLALLFAALFALAFGVLWEFVEIAARDVAAYLDLTPLLTPYGLRDTAEDLLFDALGAGVVVVLHVRLFVPVVGRFDFVRIPVLDEATLALLVLVVALGEGLDAIEARIGIRADGGSFDGDAPRPAAAEVDRDGDSGDS